MGVFFSNNVGAMIFMEVTNLFQGQRLLPLLRNNPSTTYKSLDNAPLHIALTIRSGSPKRLNDLQAISPSWWSLVHSQPLLYDYRKCPINDHINPGDRIRSFWSFGLRTRSRSNFDKSWFLIHFLKSSQYAVIVTWWWLWSHFTFRLLGWKFWRRRHNSK